MHRNQPTRRALAPHISLYASVLLGVSANIWNSGSTVFCRRLLLTGQSLSGLGSMRGRPIPKLLFGYRIVGLLTIGLSRYCADVNQFRFKSHRSPPYQTACQKRGNLSGRYKSYGTTVN